MIFVVMRGTDEARGKDGLSNATGHAVDGIPSLVGDFYFTSVLLRTCSITIATLSFTF
jgi:hypothetical protein